MSQDPLSFSNEPKKEDPAQSRLADLARRVGPSFGKKITGSPWGLLAVGVLSSAVAVLLALYWVLGTLIHLRAEVVVPDVTGKTLEQALDALSPLKLSLVKDAVQVDENFPSGTVLRQMPPAGLKVREWKIVHVTLSSGGRVLFVPDLVGVTLTEAQNRLRSLGLLLGAMSQSYSTQKPMGEVMEQNPGSGGVIKPGAMVDLKVSKGPPPEGTLLMPDFTNRPFALAKQWAKDANVAYTSTEEMSEILPGIVLRQTPAPDSPLGEKAAVSFVVAKSSSTSAKEVQWVRYEVPAGSSSVRVRVVLRDDAGEQEVFNAQRSPGALVEVAVNPQGPARARVFVDDVLIEERTLP